jgi:membrane protein DedA with SNARE-associated domain
VGAHPLPGIFATLAPLLDHYGYLAIAALLFLENLGAPVVPGETMLIAGAIYAGAGKLNIVVVGVIAVVASVAGSCGGYAIGRFGGHALVLRYGRYVLLTSERLDKAERFFTRRGAVVVLLGRFFEILRQASGIISGIAEMGWLRFVSYTSAGAVLWVGVWASVGYLAGDHITTIYHDMTRYSLYVLIAVAVIIVALIVRRVMRRRRRTANPAGTVQSGAGTVDSAGTAEHGHRATDTPV